MSCCFRSFKSRLCEKTCKMFAKDILYNAFNTPYFDCVAKLYVLCHAAQGDKSLMTISFDNIDDNLFQELTDILSNSELQVRTLHLKQAKLSDEGVADLFKRASVAFTILDYLQFINNQNGLMLPSSCTSLTQLMLSHNPLGVSAWYTVIRDSCTVWCMFLST